MENRFLGNSGFKVPAFTLGTVTFGGKVEDFGGTTAEAARRLVDVCLDHGLNMFDSADGYAGARQRRSWATRSRAVATKS